MRDPMPVLAKLGADLTKTNEAGQLYRRTGNAEVKAIVLLAATSSSPAQDFAVLFGVPEDVMEKWWEEARQMIATSTLMATADARPRPLGIVA